MVAIDSAASPLALKAEVTDLEAQVHKLRLEVYDLERVIIKLTKLIK